MAVSEGMNRRVLAVVAVLFSCLAACEQPAAESEGAASDLSAEQEVPLYLYGPFRSADDAADPVEMVFQDDHYRFVSASGEESGTFVLDRTAKVLHLVDETGRAYDKPFEVLTTWIPGTPQGDVHPASLVGSQQLTGNSVALVNSVKLLEGSEYTLVQTISDCHDMYGAGYDGLDSQFDLAFLRGTKGVNLQGIPGCLVVNNVYRCTTYYAQFRTWDNSDGTSASCNAACNEPGGFVQTAKSIARNLGTCAMAANSADRKPGDDALHMMGASVEPKPGKVTNGMCVCSVVLHYKEI